ncbi:MAG: iron ABC transporter permease, partial [Synergistaceae bacterium]|nr:iron ABC transporter permease [Synergistaceae bacterium]
MNKRFINFLLTMLFVILVGTWIYTSVRDEFLKQSRTAQRRTVETVAAGYPEPEDVEDWLNRLADEAKEYTVAFVPEIPMPGEKLSSTPKGDKNLAALTENSALDPEFSKGFDNAAYEEIYRASKNWTVGTKEEQAIFFAPAVSLKTHDIEGALVFAFNTDGEQNFMRMLNTLFFGAFILFAVVIWQLMLSRDPIVGFALAGLFLMTLIFVAYPLFEALRLSFVENGKFSLSTWKTILNSEGYLSALWGSLKLGCWTATFSTIIGFLFAFAVARTNAPCKKLISTMGVLPVISPPFSLTLSIILLFGNNGLITRWLRVIGLDFSIYGLPGLVIVQTMGMFPIAFLTLSG